MKPMMIETEFTTEIRAPREAVWLVLWEEETFKDWASIIDEGTVMKGVLAEGGLVEFISTVNGYGVTSLVKELKPFEYILFHHDADTKDSGEAFRDQEWTGGRESYRLTEDAGITTLTVMTDIPSDLIEIFNERLPQALSRIKTLSELGI